MNLWRQINSGAMHGKIAMMIVIFFCDLGFRWYNQDMVDSEAIIPVEEEEESGYKIFWFYAVQKPEVTNVYSWENIQRKYQKFQRYMVYLAKKDLGMRFTVGIMAGSLFNLFLQIIYFYDEVQGYEVDTAVRLYQHNLTAQERGTDRQQTGLMMYPDDYRSRQMEQNTISCCCCCCGDPILPEEQANVQKSVANRSRYDGDLVNRRYNEFERQARPTDSLRTRSSSISRISQTSGLKAAAEEFKPAPPARFRSKSQSAVVDRQPFKPRARGGGAGTGMRRSKDKSHSDESWYRRTPSIADASPQRKRSFSKIPQPIALRG